MWSEIENEDDLEENNLDDEIESPEILTKKIHLGDKIFGAHNNPGFSEDHSENFDADLDHKMLEDSYDEEEYLHRKKLEETIYLAFQSSRWHPLSYKKKIPKDLIPHLFQDVMQGMEGTEFSFSEKFVGICDFVKISYAKAYEIIPAKYKELIINELETKFKALSKRKIKRLF
jgi:hypothetical protein